MFWGIVVGIICFAGIFLGGAAIFDRLIGVENPWKSVEYTGYIAAGIGVLAYFAVTYRTFPPIIAAIFLALSILGFGFSAFTPRPAAKPPYLERLGFGAKENPAPVEEIIIEEEE
jgi:hypothetical protein